MNNLSFHQPPKNLELLTDKPKESKFISLDDKPGINWIHSILLFSTLGLALFGLIFVRPTFYSLVFGFIMYLWSGLGITAGYHRLWSHRAYTATFPVRLVLLLGGAAALEGSAKWWCRNHRAHHRYTDTDKDPYDARKGFWYAHMGWMLQKQNGKKIGFADISDLAKDPLIQWQHKYYPLIALFFSIVLPTCIASLWGDALGGYFYSCMVRIVIVHHATFCVNSLAHTLGDKSFSDFHTAVDSFVTAVLTFGEGYHNYHHEFPQDYRNGIKYYHFDPTKWLIGGLSFFGLTYNLKQVEQREIDKARLQMEERQMQLEQLRVSGKSKSAGGKGGRVVTWNEVRGAVECGEQWIVVEGAVYDVKPFAHQHPGGRQTLLAYLGQDATRHFQGHAPVPSNTNTTASLTAPPHFHPHSTFARTYLPLLFVGHLKPKTDGA